MKKFSKKTAIVLSVVFGLFLIVGLLFSFVPMNFGNKTWVGLSNSVNISSDIVGGIYGEFEIKSEEPTRDDINKSKTIIRDVLKNRGYSNANIYDIAGEKIRVELSYPKGSTTYQDTINSLNILTSGKLVFQSASSVDETTIKFDASDAVKEVTYTTESNYMSILVEFNDYGKEQYELLCNKVSSSNKIYLAFGSAQPQEVDISAALSNKEFSKLVLSGETKSYEALYELMQKIQVGCIPVEFNEKTVSINTMSAGLTAGEGSSSPEDAMFFSSANYVILISLIAFVAAIILGMFGIKFGYYAILIFITMLTNAILFLAVICLIPSVEFGMSAFLTMIISMAIIYAYAFEFAMSVKKEYNAGKSLSAALEATFKNKIVKSVTAHIVLFLSALSFILLSFGEISSVAIIFGISVFLSALTNIFIIPFLIKIFISFGNFGLKLFMLKKRSISETIDAEEKEAI